MFYIFNHEGIIVAERDTFSEARRRAGREHVVIERRGQVAPDRRPIPTLTGTQKHALDTMRFVASSRHQWPAAPGDAWTPMVRWSKRTLDALVDAGWAQWVYNFPGSGVLPYVAMRGDLA